MLKKMLKSKHFKSGSNFNKIFTKIFGIKIIFQNGVFWYDIEKKKKPQFCSACNQRLSIVPGTKYFYKYKDDEHVEIKTDSIENNSVKIHGWIVEYRYSDETKWYSHWNKKVYMSKEQALAAISQSKSSYQSHNVIEFRITPLYNIDAGYYRDIKIAEIFKDKIPDISPKFYKLNRDYEKYDSYKKGRIFVDIDGYHCWCLATPTMPKIGSHLSHLIKEMKSKGVLDEVKIEDEKWILPHINREVKEFIKP